MMIPLLDTHQHLIFPERLGYDWMKGLPMLAGGRFGVRDYQALTEGLGVAGTIFMECDVSDGAYRAEAEVVAGAARAPGSGIRGIIASLRPEVAEGFEAWVEEAPSLGVVGFRRILHETSDEVSRGALFRANVARLGAAGFPFDMCFLARQLPIALELARACPETVLVMDHCGVPDIASGAFDAWRDGVTALAAMPNVVAKISGVLAYCAPGGATIAAVRPYVEHVIAAFGPERCLWGSDWPVVNKTADLPGWIAMTRVFLGELSETEAAAIAHGTAGRVYGVTL